MYQFELKPWISPRANWEKEVEKIFDGFNRTHPYSPATEVIEGEKYFSLSLDVPGMKKEDIDIELKENLLSISGERKPDARTEKDNMVRSEKRYGKFTRTFTLPQNVNVEGIEAKFENGVLEVVLPKEEKVLAKKITISDWKKAETPELKN